MAIQERIPWAWLEQQRAKLFIVSGLMFIGAGSHKVLGATAGIELPLFLQNVLGGQGGLLVALLGLAGLYPALSNHRPRLARVGALGIGIGVVGLAMVLVVVIAIAAWEASFGGTIEPPGVVFAPIFVGYIGSILAFLVLGSVGVETRIPSRLIASLLVLTPLVELALIVGPNFVPFELPSAAGLGVPDLFLPIAFLVIGALLRGAAVSTGDAGRASDVAGR